MSMFQLSFACFLNPGSSPRVLPHFIVPLFRTHLPLLFLPNFLFTFIHYINSSIHHIQLTLLFLLLLLHIQYHTMANKSSLLFFVFTSFIFTFSSASRHLNALMEPEQPLTMTYHKGALLTGPISVNLIWYGKFTSSQKAIITDFIASFAPSKKGGYQIQPSVSSWFKTTEKYFTQSKTRMPRLTLGKQVLDESCSLGKSLSDSNIASLASRGAHKYAVNVVLTSADVAVDGFCMSRCGTHGSSARSKSGRFAYIWVGNSETQCPGQCAWPFHQPAYGPQEAPLVAPNGDVGVDGMVINLASMLAGTVTNPFGNGFFQGPKEAPLEASSACTGVYGKGAYPGYAGELPVDPTSGASYNVNGRNGRKYLVPALWDPATAVCSTPLV